MPVGVVQQLQGTGSESGAVGQVEDEPAWPEVEGLAQLGGEDEQGLVVDAAVQLHDDVKTLACAVAGTDPLVGSPVAGRWVRTGGHVQVP